MGCKHTLYIRFQRLYSTSTVLKLLCLLSFAQKLSMCFLTVETKHLYVAVVVCVCVVFSVFLLS